MGHRKASVALSAVCRYRSYKVFTVFSIFVNEPRPGVGVDTIFIYVFFHDTYSKRRLCNPREALFFYKGCKGSKISVKEIIILFVHSCLLPCLTDDSIAPQGSADTSNTHYRVIMNIFFHTFTTRFITYFLYTAVATFFQHTNIK